MINVHVVIKLATVRNLTAETKVKVVITKYFLMIKIEKDLGRRERGFIDSPSLEAFKNGLAKYLIRMTLRRLHPVLRQKTNQSPS